MTPAPKQNVLAGRRGSRKGKPGQLWVVTRTATAWDSIGVDGSFRIKGGKAIYDAVIYNCKTGVGPDWSY